VREEEIEALVDTGATMLVLPADVVERLGLAAHGAANVRLADGTTRRVVRVGVRCEILGRDTFCDALVFPAGSTALIGQIPLEALDLIVDPLSPGQRGRDVRVNPASPDVPCLDVFAAA